MPLWKRKRNSKDKGKRGKNEDGPVILVATADEHINSRVGLCPREGVDLDNDGRYLPSRGQLWLYNRWADDFWPRIDSLRKKIGGEVWWINVGDGADDNYHNKYGLITLNKSLIVRLAVESYQPALDVADKTFFIRGTSAHVGRDAEIEEQIAYECGATMDGSSYSSYVWRLQIHGTRILARHKPISNSTRLHTRGGGANRCAVQIMMESTNIASPYPHIALFGHYHHPEDSGENYPVHVYFLPCWKLHGNYDKYMGFSVERIGGRVFIIRGDRWESLSLNEWTYTPRIDRTYTSYT